MRRRLVRRRGVGISIHFHQDETGGVVLLLYHIKAHNARFLQTQARVPERGGFECLHEFRLNPDMNMNNIHARSIGANSAVFKREENRGPWCFMPPWLYRTADFACFLSASNTSGMVDELALLLTQVGREPPGAVKSR